MVDQPADQRGEMVIFLVRLEFEIKLEPLLLYHPTAAAPATPAAPLF